VRGEHGVERAAGSPRRGVRKQQLAFQLDVRDVLAAIAVPTLVVQSAANRFVIAARLTSLAGPDEVVVSSTVKDLVACSGIRFQDRGIHVLKGVPEQWHVFAAQQP
jgi:hypothetical protein